MAISGAERALWSVGIGLVGQSALSYGRMEVPIELAWREPPAAHHGNLQVMMKLLPGIRFGISRWCIRINSLVLVSQVPRVPFVVNYGWSCGLSS